MRKFFIFYQSDVLRKWSFLAASKFTVNVMMLGGKWPYHPLREKFSFCNLITFRCNTNAAKIKWNYWRLLVDSRGLKLWDERGGSRRIKWKVRRFWVRRKDRVSLEHIFRADFVPDIDQNVPNTILSLPRDFQDLMENGSFWIRRKNLGFVTYFACWFQIWLQHFTISILCFTVVYKISLSLENYLSANK